MNYLKTNNVRIGKRAASKPRKPMSARRAGPSKGAFVAVLVTVLAILPAGVSAAGDSVTAIGALDCEPVPPATVVESVDANTVTLEFPSSGGPFTGTALLTLNHYVPDRGCRFVSSHAWEFTGDFQPGTLQFSGDYIEVQETTTGECENFTFARTFTPDTARFLATLGPLTGAITSQINPLEFTLMVDPALLVDLVPADPEPGPSDPTTDSATTPGEVTSTSGGATASSVAAAPSEAATDSSSPAGSAGTSGTDTGGGFPWVLLLIALLAAAVFFAVRRIWSVGKTPGGGPVRDGDGVDDRESRNCNELERAWRAAQDRCESTESKADSLSERFDEIAEDHKQKQLQLDGLPSEETRVQLPDGTRMSQLDLHLRSQAAGAAWDAYMADPSPATASAAEDAWSEKATPEWLDEQRRARAQRKEQLEREVEQATADKDRVGTELAAARRAQQDECAEAAAARRRLDDCLQRARATPPPPTAAERDPTPQAPAYVPPHVPPPRRADPVPAEPTQPEPAQQARDKGCREGEETREMFDGPHPFKVPTQNDRVAIKLQLIAGTRRTDRLGSLDNSDFARLDGRGRAESISFDRFENLSAADIRRAFSGPGGLAGLWETVGAGAVQQLTITLSFEFRNAMASCERVRKCIGGQWKSSVASRVTGEVERATERALIKGNITAGIGRTEDDYLTEVVALFTNVQGRLRALRSAQEVLEDYQKDCRAGRRG